jgi:aryl-alcohol dehydrogenase-like predicted oxidoreductase
MKKRLCGNSDLELPLLGIGCWAFGSGGDDYWGDQDQKDVDAVVHRALELGCNYFDTAEVYNQGASEKSLGQALKGLRHQAIIGSKINPSNAAPDTLRRHCENSLDHLGTDYLDIYMVHWPIHPHSVRHFTDDEGIIAHPPSVEDAFATLMALQKEGKIRYIGVSNFGVQQLQEALATGAEIILEELPYSLLMRGIEPEILPFCREREIGILAYMPLMQGILTGKYRTPEEIPESRARTRHFPGTRPGSRHGEEGCEPELFAALRKIRKIALEQDLEMGDLALAWCAANPVVTSVLAGARQIEQLEANASSIQVHLDDELVERLNRATNPVLEKLGPGPDYYEGKKKSRSW